MATKAVYAGTFDPITNGHLDIIERAAGIFEDCYVAVVEKPNKKTLFESKDRVSLVQESLGGLRPETSARVKVVSFDGLLVEFVQGLGCSVVIRGLRAVSDYEYEAQMAIINRHLAENIETVFLMTSDRCSFISSSIVREIAKLKGDIKGLVPPPVEAKLKQLFA